MVNLPAATMSADEYMQAAPALVGSNSAYGVRYGQEIKRIIDHAARRAPRSMQVHLGPSELGVQCDGQVVRKLLREPRTNHIADPWPSIVGTSIHAWLAGAFDRENNYQGWTRYLTEQRVAPTNEHPGSTDLYDAQERACVDWKGLYVHTPIATPDGWTTIDQLKAGDTVFGSDGRPCQITCVYPIQHRECYRIAFRDGSDLITDDVQELPFVISGRRPRAVTLSAAEAAGQVWSKTARPQRQLRLYNGGALELPERDLIVHPYVLGCWLGDGSVHGGTIGKPDGELFDYIRSCGYEVSAPHGQKQLVRTIYGLSTQLRQLGLQWADPEHPRSHGRLTGAKRIPQEYLRASRSQRLELLRGLMDTDGTWNRKRNQAVFTTTNKDLAESVAELVVTLAWKAHIAPQQAHGFGLTVTAYHVSFVPMNFNPFQLSRKANLVRLEGSLVSEYRLVQSIKPVLSVPTKCIDVNSPDHLYLAGEQMVPVHNCLGPTTMAKIKQKGGPPRQYRGQILLYALGCLRKGLPVDKVMIIALPRTASTLDDLYVWHHPFGGPEDIALLREVLDDTARRKTMAEQVRNGTMQLRDVPIAPEGDLCYYCPFYRSNSSRNSNEPGCPGTTVGRSLSR